MTDVESLVFVVDDDAQVRRSLVNLLRSVSMAAEALASTDEFLSYPRPNIPSCLVLDIRFPESSQSGLDFHRHLSKEGINIPVIFVTGHGDVPMSACAMKSGAIDFLLKPVRERKLLEAIRVGLEKDRHRLDREQAMQSLNAKFELLTSRERDVLDLLMLGLMNKQIAAELNLSEVMVKVRRGHIMHKMQAKTLVDLVRMSDAIQIAGLAPATMDSGL